MHVIPNFCPFHSIANRFWDKWKFMFLKFSVNFLNVQTLDIFKKCCVVIIDTAWDPKFLSICSVSVSEISDYILLKFLREFGNFYLKFSKKSCCDHIQCMWSLYLLKFKNNLVIDRVANYNLWFQIFVCFALSLTPLLTKSIYISHWECKLKWK